MATVVPESMPALAMPGFNDSPRLEKLLFGDNQFFGVNHMSEQRAREQEMRFQSLDAVMEVLDAAYDDGISTFMCTTHDRIAQVAQRVADNSERYRRFSFYPCMPYAHKYADAVTESGMLGALKRFLPEEGLLNAAWRGGKAFAHKDVEGLITLLVDAEMAMFRDVRTPVVWLQNVVIDLLLGLGFRDAFGIFAQHVRERYNAQPGFITMNLPMLLDTLDSAGIANPLVCSNINKIGFRMSGGVEGYLRALDKRPFRAVAMSVFASGAIEPHEAIEWVGGLPNVESLVFGASTVQHVHQTRALVDQFFG